ncbi:MAG: lipopolysaccharide heptosyltransferase II [Victivallales bacterium]|nr:lipopolysaccharide heptosyltransferase II [Victivallales bacterium]
MNILIVKPSSLGDILHAFPAVSLLAEHYPGANIDWLVNRQLAPLIEFHPAVSEAIIFPREELGSPIKFPKTFMSLVHRLREKKYDLIVDFQGLMRSAVFAKLAKSSNVVGFAKPRERISAGLYNRRIDIPTDAVHAVERNLHLVCSLLDIGFVGREPGLKTLQKAHDTVVEKLAKEGIAKNDTIVGIAPVARWKSKTWPPEFFADVVSEVHRKITDVRFVVIGSEADSEAAEKIVSAVNTCHVVSMAGETVIPELVEMVKLFSCLLSNDSGPVHVAWAAKVPVFALFGPTSPSKTGPYGKINRVFQDGECSECLQRECPDKSYRCHKSINAKEVAEALATCITKEKESGRGEE